MTVSQHFETRTDDDGVVWITTRRHERVPAVAAVASRISPRCSLDAGNYLIVSLRCSLITGLWPPCDAAWRAARLD